MTQTPSLEKRCFGYKCELNDRCKHHFALFEHFFMPNEKGKDCPHFESVHNEYGRRVGDEDEDD